MAMQVGSRRDALPEASEYRDTGCEVAPSCLRCPLPQCRYDTDRTAAERARQSAERKAEILSLHEAGVAAPEIAARVGVTPTTVYRTIRKARAS